MRINVPPKRGRPRIPSLLARANVSIRLPQWILLWMTRHGGGSPTEVIERALVEYYDLKPPPDRE